jgi:hypothetical protein
VSFGANAIDIKNLPWTKFNSGGTIKISFFFLSLPLFLYLGLPASLVFLLFFFFSFPVSLFFPFLLGQQQKFI